MAHSVEGTRESFQKDRTKHHAELSELHILLARSPVIEERTENHVFQLGVGNELPDIFAGGASGGAESELIVPGEPGDEFAQTVDLGGEFLRDFVFKALKIVRKVEFDAGEGDGRAVLLDEAEFVPGHAQMTNNARQGAAFRSLGNVIRHRMKPDVEFSTVMAIKRIESADDAVLFQDANVIVELSEPYPRRETGHTRADNNRVVNFIRHIVR